MEGICKAVPPIFTATEPRSLIKLRNHRLAWQHDHEVMGMTFGNVGPRNSTTSDEEGGFRRSGRADAKPVVGPRANQGARVSDNEAMLDKVHPTR